MYFEQVKAASAARQYFHRLHTQVSGSQGIAKRVYPVVATSCALVIATLAILAPEPAFALRPNNPVCASIAREGGNCDHDGSVRGGGGGGGNWRAADDAGPGFDLQQWGFRETKPDFCAVRAKRACAKARNKNKTECIAAYVREGCT